jgi:hypothetical protein
MIFASGVVLFLIGALVITILGTGNPYVHNKADAWGALAVFSGLALAIGSVLHFAAKWLA